MTRVVLSTLIEGAQPIGYTGSQGDTGYIGSQGNLGYSGSQGDLGFTGSRGIYGYTGSFGYTGSQGDIGYTGSRGYAGSRGDTGFVGSQGNLGYTGSRGYAGSQGIQGVQGVQGNLGYTGSQGIGYTGSRGDVGFVGSQGSQGIQGPVGPQGISVTLQGSVSSAATLPASGSAGQGYITNDTGHLWFWNVNTSQWQDIGQIVGPQGETGYVGSLGFTGSQGAGFTGSQGDTGFIGSFGYTGSLGYTGSQGVGFTGSQGIGYTGSQGATGFVGSQGMPGDPGAPGAQGPSGTSVQIVGSVASSANLPSPYNGSTGDGYLTEDNGHLWVWSGTSWTDVGSIKGYTGSQGDTGLTGLTGDRGDTGYTGSIGSLGYTGSQGVGYTGSIGYTGSYGDLGYTGSQGDRGDPGETGFVGSRGAAGLNDWVTISSNYTASNKDRLMLYSAGGQFTLTLPATPATGTYIQVTDAANLAYNPVLVNTNGSTIENLAGNLILDFPNATYEFIYDGSTWQVTSTAGPQGYTGSVGYTGSIGVIGYTGSLGSISVSLIDPSNTVSNSVTGVTAIRFDSDAGFDVTDLGSGAVKVGMNSTFKYWEVDGQSTLVATGLDTVEFVAGNNIVLTTNVNASPKSLTISSNSSLSNIASVNGIENQDIVITTVANIGGTPMPSNWTFGQYGETFIPTSINTSSQSYSGAYITTASAAPIGFITRDGSFNPYKYEFGIDGIILPGTASDENYSMIKAGNLRINTDFSACGSPVFSFTSSGNLEVPTSIFAGSYFYSNGTPFIGGGGGGGGGGGAAEVTVSDTAPVAPTSGALWFDTSTSRFYFYYQDGTSNQWVGLNPAFAPLNTAPVFVSDTAPATPMSGTLWFDSSNGKFYIYYSDADSSQWISLNPVLNLATSNFSIDLLADVDTTTNPPSNGQILTWNSAANLWRPATSTNPYPHKIFVGDSDVTVTDTGSNGQVVFTLDGAAAAALTSDYLKIPSGTTATRPASPTVGMIRYNTSYGTLEQYNSNGWEVIGGNPTITSINPGSTNGGPGAVITVNGANFVSGAYVKFIGNTGVIYSAPVTSVISNSLIQATTPALPAVAKPYSVQVINPNGSSATLPAALDSGNGPSWVTATNLGTIYDSRLTNITITLQATDPESQTVTYQIISALPPGLTLDTNTGVLSGTLSSVATDTTYTFTIAANDSVGNSTNRTFTLLQKAPVITMFTTVGSTSWVAPTSVTSVQVLVVAGGGGGGNGSASGAGGGGGGGGLIYDAAFTVVPGNTYTVSVGNGGSANIAGGASQFGSYTTNGGGNGGSATLVGGTGGNGGGAGGSASAVLGGGSTNTAYGTNGGSNAVSATAPGGGGGGAGSSGSAASTNTGGLGGTGRNINITGSFVFYGGGGGGGAGSGGAAGSGGPGGGANGSNGAATPTAATANLGGGGGGGGGPSAANQTGGAGGSGVVIIRY